METEEEFWLKKRGQYPFATYQGNAVKAVVNIKIKLDEIGERLKKDAIIIANTTYRKEK